MVTVIKKVLIKKRLRKPFLRWRAKGNSMPINIVGQ